MDRLHPAQTPLISCSGCKTVMNLTSNEFDSVMNDGYKQCQHNSNHKVDRNCTHTQTQRGIQRESERVRKNDNCSD